MKKKLTVITACSLLFAITMFSGCAADTSADTGGSGGSGTSSSVLWSKFDGADLQIWSNTFTAESSDTDGMVFTVGSSGWWGGCFCNNAADAVGSATTFDMSDIAKITFDVKGSAAGSFWVSCSNSSAAVTGQTAIALTTDWVNKTFSCASYVSSTDYGVLDVGGGDLGTTSTSGYKVYIKNIAFWDASGNEIVPARSE
jgi:hypothetical protein